MCFLNPESNSVHRVPQMREDGQNLTFSKCLTYRRKSAFLILNNIQYIRFLQDQHIRTAREGPKKKLRVFSHLILLQAKGKSGKSLSLKNYETLYVGFFNLMVQHKNCQQAQRQSPEDIKNEAIQHILSRNWKQILNNIQQQ